jgi:hypothetical protein
MIRECAIEMLEDRLELLHACESDFAPGELVIALLGVALSASTLSAPLVINRYRHLMTRLMGMQQLHSTSAVGSFQERPFADVPKEPFPSMSFPELVSAATQRQSRIRRATVLAYLTFVAGCGIALPLHEFHSTADYASKLIAAAALGSGPAFINAIPRISHWWLITIATLLLIPAGLLEDQSGPDDSESVFFGLLFIIGFALVAVHRTWRCIFVPLTIITFFVATGFLLAVWLFGPGSCSQITAPTFNRHSNLIATILMLPAALIPAWIGQLSAGAFSRAHEHGFFSDISIVAGFGLAVYAALISFSADSTGITNLQIIFAWLAWMALTIGAYIWSLSLVPPPIGSCPLLVLRVFSRTRKTENLLDTLQTRWRYAGPVLEIGGPDLAGINVDIREFSKFIAGSAHELFVSRNNCAEQIEDHLELDMDREGRFRINEVFCFESVWQTTVEQLIELTSAVLIDIRGFNAKRVGTAFELTLLCKMQRLDRTVLVGDSSTDWALVDNIIGQEVHTTRLHAQSSNLIEDCMTALLKAATKETQAE